MYADAETLKELNTLKRLPARASGEEGQAAMQDRTLHFYYTTSAVGKLVCTVLLIKDNRFERLDMLQLEDKLYLMLVPPSREPEVGGKPKLKWRDGPEVAEKMWTEAILPEEFAERERVGVAGGFLGRHQAVTQSDCLFDAEQEDDDDDWSLCSGDSEDQRLDAEEDAIRAGHGLGVLPMDVQLAEGNVEDGFEREETDAEADAVELFSHWAQGTRVPTWLAADLKIANLADGDSSTCKVWMKSVVDSTEGQNVAFQKIAASASTAWQVCTC